MNFGEYWLVRTAYRRSGTLLRALALELPKTGGPWTPNKGGPIRDSVTARSMEGVAPLDPLIMEVLYVTL